MYSCFSELGSNFSREHYNAVDLGTAANQLIQLVNSLNFSSTILQPIANNPMSFTNQAVSFEGGTTIDASGNVIIGPTPTLPSHAITLGFLNNYMTPGSAIVNSLLGDTITTMVLDMVNLASSTYVQGCIADGAMPIQNTSSIYGNGWRYVNNNSTYPAITNPSNSVWNKINWYIFNNTTANNAYAYSRFNCGFIRLQFASSSATQSGNLPFLTVYTLPQASGNGASWYRSKKSFSTSTITPNVNTDVILYAGTDPRLYGFRNLNAVQYIPLTFTSSGVSYSGPSGQTDITPTETISLMSWGSNSASSTGSIDFTVIEMGYCIGSALNRVVTYY